ncbi:MAG: hypothetical protein FJ276_17360 [Planctomycetes bacterium]|nr:hypothetical protein [Planctomycetota bacterium]
MNRRMVWGTTLVALLMFTASVFAQGQRGGGQRGAGMMGMMRGMSMVQLLQNEAVRKEIVLTEEQQSKLREMAQAAREGAGGGMPNFQEMSDEERQKLREEMTKRAEETQKKLAEILDDKQMTRLKEINLQVMGARAFMLPEVSDALGITNEQREKIQTAQREAFQGLMGGGAPDPEQMAKAQEQVKETIMNILSDEQKSTFKKMVGEPFDVTQVRGAGRGGPGGEQGERPRGGRRKGSDG